MAMDCPSNHIFMSKLKLILKNIKTCSYWYLEADNSDGFNNKISSRKRSAAKAFHFFSVLVLDLSQTSSRIRSRLETSVMCHLGVIVFQKLCFIWEGLEKIDLEQTIISKSSPTWSSPLLFSPKNAVFSHMFCSCDFMFSTKWHI